MALSLFSLLQSRFAPADGGLTRRDMLRASLAGAAGLFLRDHLAFGAQERKAGKRVIVIGAGFAGVAAAHELHTKPATPPASGGASIRWMVSSRTNTSKPAAN
jgi:hypothetical protein